MGFIKGIENGGVGGGGGRVYGEVTGFCRDGFGSEGSGEGWGEMEERGREEEN